MTVVEHFTQKKLQEQAPVLLQQGRKEEAEEIARRFLSEGLSVEMVAKCTGIPVETLKSWFH